jgi:hypothetical protein
MTDFNIDQMVNEYDAFKAQFTEKATNALRAAFAKFFENNPQIQQIGWTQYTPYFNDGDECIFGVNDMSFITDSVEDQELAENEDVGKWHQPWQDHHPFAAPFLEFTKQMGRLPDEVYQSAFGDHVQVIATRDGFEVDEYEHD